MNGFQDLSTLKRRWQAGSPPVPDSTVLHQRLAADTRAHWRVLALVSVGSLLVLLATWLHARQEGSREGWGALVFTGLFITVVWVAALWLSRGTWRPRDESLVAHLEVSIRRCRSTIFAAPIGIVLYVAGLAGSLLWKQRLYGVDWKVLLEQPAMILAGWIGAPLYTGLMIWNADRQRRRLRALQQLMRQLRED